MLPSFYLSGDKPQTWSVVRAATYGAGLGVVAALFKALGPSHGPFGGSMGSGGILGSGGFLPMLPEIVVAALSFAALCAAAAVLRNFIAQRLIWPRG